jgi:hypothetical protein
VVAGLGLSSAAWSAEPGLVGHYNFDEGSGAVLRDVSGNGNDGQIHGAHYVPRGRGYCLEFDGAQAYIDCGSNPSLDLRGALTLEAWVCPAHRVKGEPGILGKHFESYLLSYYADGQCWWYISGGGNNAKSLLTPGGWIEGKERLITCISGTFVWPARNRPVVHLFDLNGREKSRPVPISRCGKGWKVDLKLEDWGEVAIVEESI